MPRKLRKPPIRILRQVYKGKTLHRLTDQPKIARVRKVPRGRGSSG